MRLWAWCSPKNANGARQTHSPWFGHQGNALCQQVLRGRPLCESPAPSYYWENMVFHELGVQVKSTGNVCDLKT